MKKILSYHIYILLLLCIVAGIVILPSCQKENTDPPSISYVRNYAASPNDTILNSVSAGQWVVLIGKNLSGVTRALFGTTPATINNTLFSDTSIVIQIPDIPFPLIPRNEVNAITVVNDNGTAIYNISITGTPIISYVSTYDAEPKDSVVSVLFPAQKINLTGYNLNNVTSISFQGVNIDLSSIVYTDTSVIMQVPADLSGGDIAHANSITYTTSTGSVTFPIKIVGPPLITYVSCENPSEGSTVYLKGYNFISVQSLTFAKTDISSFTLIGDSIIGFTVPTLSQSGPVVVTTPAGTNTTIFNVNDFSTGMLCNFDDISPIGWGGWGADVKNSDTDFPGNHRKYASLHNDIIPPWDWQAWAGGRIIILDAVKWLPAANANDPLDSWAVKFELNVPQGWNGNSLFVSSEHNDYKITWEPWKKANGQTFAFTTNGWQTITLPFSLFMKNWGGTTPPADLTDLLGSTESNGFAIQTMNIASANSATGLNAAVDNIRIIKIK